MQNNSPSKVGNQTNESKANIANTYYQDPSQIEINGREHQEHHIVPQESSRTQPEGGADDDGTCKAKVRKNKWILVSVLGFMVLVGLIVGLVVGLYKGMKKENTPPDQVGPTTIPYNCENYPSDCIGVPTNVRSYIFSTYTQKEQIQSLLQTSRSISSIPTNTTRQNFVSVYRDILKSTECLSYNLPSSYAQAYQDLLSVQLVNEEDIQKYLEMSQAFSGQPFKSTSTGDLPSTCSFNLTSPPPSGRRLQLGTCSANQTSVLVLLHGLGYSPSSTVENLRSIQATINAANNDTITFDGGSVILGAYRNEGVLGFLLQMVSAYQQKQRSENRTVSSNLDILKCLRLIIDLNGRTSKLPATITPAQYEQLYNFFVQKSLQSFLNNQTEYSLSKQKDFLVQQIQEGKKVVLVAHGEASLYANVLYQLLSDSEKDSVGLIFIGPFADTMADNSSAFITNPADSNVNYFRNYANETAGIEPPLAPNSQTQTWNSDIDFGRNHALQGYMTSYADEFVNLIGSTRSRITQPARTLGSGPITVALTWDSQPDLDLHVFEPAYHVYYSQATGPNGFLDRDDTNGYGPEHYYTGCTLQVGNYTPKVNFYSGSAPSHAMVTVSAGSEYFVKQLIISNVAGSSGDVNPEYTICTITVRQSPYTGSYLFSITQ